MRGCHFLAGRVVSCAAITPTSLASVQVSETEEEDSEEEVDALIYHPPQQKKNTKYTGDEV